MRTKPQRLAWEAKKLRQNFDTFLVEHTTAWKEFCCTNRKAIVGALALAAKKKRLKPPLNFFAGEGARGGCFFEIESEGPDKPANLRVGWSCVIVHDGDIPITWLAELVAIATAHKDGVAGFLKEQNYAGGYALEVDPPGILLPDPPRHSPASQP